MNDVVIVCGGDDFNIKKLKSFCRKENYIIGVDAGLNLIHRIKARPDLIIGDMDSVDKSILDKYKYTTKEVFPENKDHTDTELAIMRALELKPKNIYLFASTGSYLDHTYANIFSLFKYSSKNTDISIITGNSTIYPVQKEKTIAGKKGHRFSLFFLSDPGKISLTGCKYYFKNRANMSFLDYSVSNVITDNIFNVKIKTGLAFLVLFDKGYK